MQTQKIAEIPSVKKAKKMKALMQQNRQSLMPGKTKMQTWKRLKMQARKRATAFQRRLKMPT